MEEQVLLEETVQEAPKAPVKKPKEVVRPNEELIGVDPKKMTEKEKINFINYLLNTNEDLAMKVERLQDNCKSAYAKSNEMEKMMNTIQNESNLKLGLVSDTIKVLANNILTIIK